MTVCVCMHQKWKDRDRGQTISTRLLRAQWDGLAASQSTASVDEIIARDLAVDLTLFFVRMTWDSCMNLA